MSSVTDRLVAGRYRLGRVLGRGGMADVHEAQDERLGRSVAVKMLRPEVIAAHPEVRARFEAEARSAAALTHPNVVAVYDTGEHEGLPFIVMERLPGETLAEHMGRGPLDLAWLRRVAGDVLGALGAAHAAGIVHRDIKPGNILIDESGCAKVADFGIAKSLEGTGPDLTSTNLLIGTPAYMAPERVAGDPATAQADIYGVGVVLYEAAAGRKPFTGATPIALAYAIRQGGSEPLPAVRPDVDPIFASTVATAMAVEPRDRFPSAAAMASALVGSSADDPTLPAAAVGPDATMTMPASAAAVPAGAAPWWRRRDVRIGALALVGLVLLLGAMAWASGGAGNKARAESPTTVATAPPPTAAPVVVTTVAPTTTTTTFSQAVQDQIQQQMDKMRAQLERQRARGGGGGNGGGD